MKTKAEKSLDLIQVVIEGGAIECLQSSGDWGSSIFVGDSLIAAIIVAPDKYRVKPKTKTITYQTRLFKVGEVVYQWSSIRLPAANQKWLEDSYITLEWLELTQEHSFTYEEK